MEEEEEYEIIPMTPEEIWFCVSAGEGGKDSQETQETLGIPKYRPTQTLLGIAPEGGLTSTHKGH